VLRKFPKYRITLMMSRYKLRSFFAARAQARATVLIFRMDEVSGRGGIGETVNWVIVRNRERIPRPVQNLPMVRGTGFEPVTFRV